MPDRCEVCGDLGAYVYTPPAVAKPTRRCGKHRLENLADKPPAPGPGDLFR